MDAFFGEKKSLGSFVMNMVNKSWRLNMRPPAFILEAEEEGSCSHASCEITRL